MADQSPDAYEKQVERLLASPHYGERWARHWLDGARYADSNGYSHDTPRSIWPYRDWVIDALNATCRSTSSRSSSSPATCCPTRRLSQKVATGFHRNTQINEEGGIDPEQFRVEAVIDRVGTTGTVFLGLTVACAQCHNHKFDPISQKEYYRVLRVLQQRRRADAAWYRGGGGSEGTSSARADGAARGGGEGRCEVLPQVASGIADGRCSRRS